MISLIVLSLTLMFLCYQPIDHASAVMGRVKRTCLFTIAEHICSNRAGAPGGMHAGSGTSAPPSEY